MSKLSQLWDENELITICHIGMRTGSFKQCHRYRADCKKRRCSGQYSNFVCDGKNAIVDDKAPGGYRFTGEKEQV